MIRAIVWKEWREQRSIALAVLVFGVLALALTAQFADPTTGSSVWQKAGARELMPLSLAYLAGAVCGAVLLADEKEVGTLEFLDSLPSRRRNLWTGKIVFGSIFVVMQSIALALLAIALGCVDERMSRLGFASTIVFVGLLAFSWGLFGGALAKSPLGAVFQGSIASIFVAFLLAGPFTIVFGPRAMSRPFGQVLMSFYGTWLAIGLAGSWLLFTSIDRERWPRTTTSGVAVRPPRRIRGPGLRALVWLTARQAVYVTIGAVAAGAVVGAAMLAPDVIPIFLWTGATLAFGVLAGVTTLGEEQTRGVARFWAERRLPLGRLWLTKVAVHVGIALLAGLIAFLPLFAAAPASPFRSRLLAATDPGLRSELPRLLLLGLVYGFVVGHLMGMVFKKTIVASLTALVLAATFVALVLPGVIGGGASFWQVWAPAIMILLTARLILYPWATERVLARGPALRVAGGVVLALAILGAGLAFRVSEVPDVPDRLAESGFESSLPLKDANAAGRDARAAVAQFRKAAQDAHTLYPAREGPTIQRASAQPLVTIVDPLERVATQSWGPESRALYDWLDRVFEQKQDWVRLLDQVADSPIGVFDDPRDADYFTAPEAINDLRQMAAALRARGMQRQEEKDDDTFVRLLRGGLAAVRTARYKGGLQVTLAALRAEEVLLAGLTEWLARLDGRADLLRELHENLARHEREMPMGHDDTFWAEQMILRNTMDRVAAWVPRLFGPGRRDVERVTTQADAEADMVALAWTFPWEQARRERILRLQTHRDKHINPRWLSGLQLSPMSRSTRVERLPQSEPVGDRHGLTRRRFARLQVALRLFHLDRGVPASDLGQLVPAYFPEVPEDPYTGKPFCYRVSRGEILVPGGDFMSRTAQFRPFVEAAFLFAIAHPVGGLNVGWPIAYAAANAQPTSQFGPRAIGIGPPPASEAQRVTAIVVLISDGILWSAGPDGIDDGGRNLLPDGSAGGTGEDWVIVVPSRPGMPTHEPNRK